MNPRTWLAIALCFLVWFTYIRWFAPPPPTPVDTTPAPQKSQTQEIKTQSEFSVPKFDSGGEEVYENNFIKVIFSKNGGKISQVVVKKYDIPLIETPISFATLFDSSDLKSFENVSYDFQKKDDRTFVFTKTSGQGFKVIKQYSFDESKNPYTLYFKMILEAPKAGAVGNLILPLGVPKNKVDKAEPIKTWEMVIYQNKTLTRKGIDDFKEHTVFQGLSQWLSLANRYFASVYVTQSKINPDVLVDKTEDIYMAAFKYPLQFRDDKKIDFDLTLFLGPKEQQYLNEIEGFSQLVDYGMFAFLARPLVWLLNFFNKFVHNYGLAIIILTVLVRIAFFPLSKKSYLTSRQMQKIQPKIAALKEKYKDDKERLSREQMALFKAHNVNPAGGCLPMLPQLPVFFALYSALANSMELFRAPFFFWIKDLSTKDPYYILPVLMGVSMFVQQILTPSPGLDKMQQRMMYFMPILFSFFMLNLPSGLTLYIFVSTLLGILQQYMLTKDKSSESVAVPARVEGKS